MQKVIFKTDGQRGLWNNVAKAVEITNIEVGYCDEERGFGELMVYFNTATWNVDVDGLIYTDAGFLDDLQEFLNAHGLAGADVDYSEQGMQGDDYVSLDCGKEFIASWLDKFGVDCLAL